MTDEALALWQVQGAERAIATLRKLFPNESDLDRIVALNEGARVRAEEAQRIELAKPIWTPLGYMERSKAYNVQVRPPYGNKGNRTLKGVRVVGGPLSEAPHSGIDLAYPSGRRLYVHLSKFVSFEEVA